MTIKIAPRGGAVDELFERQIRAVPAYAVEEDFAVAMANPRHAAIAISTITGPRKKYA
jgi:hypothetical protein